MARLSPRQRPDRDNQESRACRSANAGRRKSAPPPPVIAAGMVFAADVEGQAILAMNAADGKLVWRCSAEGRVDSPPTYYQGLLLFGSRDGSAYCLRAPTELARRFLPGRSGDLRLRAAGVGVADLRQRSGPRRAGLFRRGEKLLHRRRHLPYALDPRSGKVVHQKRIYGPFGEDGFPIENREVVAGTSIEGFKADIFIADDKLLYSGISRSTPTSRRSSFRMSSSRT